MVFFCSFQICARRGSTSFSPNPKGANLSAFSQRFYRRNEMGRDSATSERLRNLVTKIESLTESGELHCERQLGSAHRYARLNNNLLILWAASPLSRTNVPR